MHTKPYPIGASGIPWGEAERAAWRARLSRRRSYADDVLTRIAALGDQFDIIDYGSLDYGEDRYELRALLTHNWDQKRPTALVTGGVHGYETSGITGALGFLEEWTESYIGRINLVVVPCVSPWSYERVQRWNPLAIDPNRSFRADGAAQESRLLMSLLDRLTGNYLLHVDLHETTDTDATEFLPALAARDGKPNDFSEAIPDGFYLVDDVWKPEPDLQRSIIDSVQQVTHIAPADTEGKIIGVPTAAPGVIGMDLRALGLCAGFTSARYRTTTEVYPDSPRATPEQCVTAQIWAIRAGLDYVLSHE